MMNKKNKIRFPLRIKFSIIQTIIVFIALGTMTAMVVDLVQKDKKAYTYDRIFQNSNSSTMIIGQYIESKVQISRNASQTNKSYDEISGLIDATIFTADTYEVVYRNKDIIKRYLKEPKFVTDGVYTNPTKEKVSISVETGKISSLIIDMKKSETEYVRYRFFLDDLFVNIFSNTPFKNTLVTGEGKIVYANYPNSNNIEDFYNEQIKQVTKNNRFLRGIRDVNYGDKDVIIAHQRIKLGNDLYIFTEIDSKEAFLITKQLIIKISLLSLALIGFFNIGTIFIIKGVSRPIEILMKGIAKLAEGKLNTQIIINTSDELSLVASSFNEMTYRISEYHQQLKEYNETLEQKVEERTKELKDINTFIKTVLDSLDQGLFIVNKDGVCLETSTIISKEMFGMDPSNQNALELIKSNDNTTKSWLDAMFSEAIPFESLAGLGPKKLETDNRKYKHLQLKYRPLRENDGKIKNIIFLATDVTKEIQAKEKAEEHLTLINKISNIIKSKDNFISYINTMEQSYTHAIPEMINDFENSKGELLRLLHSLKGTSSMFGMQTLADTIHNIEGEVSKGAVNQELTEKIKESYQSDIKRISQMLGDEFFNKNTLELDRKRVSDLFEEAYNIDKNLYKMLERAFFYISTEELIRPYIKLLEELSVKLNKKINPLIINGGETLIDKRKFEKLFLSLVHIFRNSADHAIESADERLALGKPNSGTVTFSLNEIDDSIIISISDDGRGIDPERIRKKMKELNYSDELINRPDKEILMHIFDEEFSTADTVSDLSGRGVGLSDIKNIVEKLNGEISLKSEINKGTEFTLSI